jgi:hypothetical protein
MHRWQGYVVVALLAGAPLQAQHTGDVAATAGPRHFIGSSAFMSLNLVLTEPADFYQLNYGYRLTERDVLSVEAITWKVDAPVGIPYGPSFESPDEKYGGYVREYGLGAAYQRFLWRDLYSALHVLPQYQRYFDEDGARIQDGFKLFLTARLGYHVGLLRGRLFLEPSVAFTYWPVDTHAPPAFAERDARWPNYFLFEPGLHFGVRF